MLGQTTEGFVYIVTSEDYYRQKIFKIGKTKRSIDERLRELNSTNVTSDALLQIFKLYKTENCTDLERKMHRQFENKKVNLLKREWYYLDDAELKIADLLALQEDAIKIQDVQILLSWDPWDSYSYSSN